MADFFNKNPGAQPKPPVRSDPLPPPARSKLAVLEGEAVDARDASMSAARRLGDLQRVLANNPKAEDAAGIEHEISRLKAVREQQNHRHREQAALAVAIAQWLRTLSPSVVLEVARPSAAKPRKDETVLQAIGRTRDEISAALQHLRLVKTAPLPKLDLKAMARAHVLAWAERGRPQVNREGAIKFKDPTSMTAGVTLDHLTAVAAWLDPEKMANQLGAVIDAMPTPELALSASEKAARIAELTRSIAELERGEEALIEAAQASGSDILRRPTASPLAVLGVAIKVQQRAEVAA